MSLYNVSVTSTVPKVYGAELVIEATSEEDARRKVQQMFEDDEIDWDRGECDYDEAELSIDEIEEVTE